MIKFQRNEYIKNIERYLKIHKICALLGPRQCGKSTLAEEYKKIHKIPEVNCFDLENYSHLEILKDPLLAFSKLSGTIIIDEVQLIPDIFKTIRVIVDNSNIKFLLLGSASIDLVNKSSETLAGRIGYLEITPFKQFEVGNEQDLLWLRGGFPKSFYQDCDDDSYLWRESYIKTFLEKDIPSLGIKIPAHNLRRFWYMVADSQASTVNKSDMGRSLGISDHTISNYLDILTGTYMIRQLKPWFENISKRQAKSPKIYFRDTGIFHFFAGIKDKDLLYKSLKIGASWEGYAIEQIINFYEASEEESYYWKSQSGYELDLLIIKNGKRLGFEIKYSSAPKITKQMREHIKILSLEKLYIITPNSINRIFDDKIEILNIDYFNIIKQQDKISRNDRELERIYSLFCDQNAMISNNDYAYVEKFYLLYKNNNEIYRENKIIQTENWGATFQVYATDAKPIFHRSDLTDLIEKEIKLQNIEYGDIISITGTVIYEKPENNNMSHGYNMNLVFDITGIGIIDKNYSFGVVV
jgi:uncharacterized protein